MPPRSTNHGTFPWIQQLGFSLVRAWAENTAEDSGMVPFGRPLFWCSYLCSTGKYQLWKGAISFMVGTRIENKGEDKAMNIKHSKRLLGALVALSLGLSLGACNTSKATVDTLAKFTSSTSPGDWINADGIVEESQKARLFSAVAFENLEQDIAHGNGEYLTSLTVLLKIPSGKQDEFMARSQSNYSLLFAPDIRTAEKMLATLISKREDLRANSQRLE